MSKIEFKDVCKRYGTQPLTINKANLTIESGEFCVFVGPSGCGKSTLLRMVAGLEDISSGELLVNGQRMNDLPPAKRGVAMVFQSYALYPHMTVYENMAFGLKTMGSKKSEYDAKVQETARVLHLEHLLDRLPKALSGGQRQRVAIGRAIVRDPKVFLFDEPLSNLDAGLRVQTRIEIAKLHQRIGTASMIYVTHDQVEAMTLANKIVLLNTGERIAKFGSIAQVGSPLSLYHRPNSLFVAEFIGSPKMNILPGVFSNGDERSAQLKIGNLSFHAAVNALSLSSGEVISLGMRPEDLSFTDTNDASNTFHGRVAHLERLGDSSLVYVEVNEQLPLITVKVEGSSRAQHGDKVIIKTQAESLHVFGKDGFACERKVDLDT